MIARLARPAIALWSINGTVRGNRLPISGLRVTRPSGVLPRGVTPCSETPYRTKKTLIFAALSDMAINRIFDTCCLLSGFDDDARRAVRLADATTANRNLRARLIGSSW